MDTKLLVSYVKCETEPESGPKKETEAFGHTILAIMNAVNIHLQRNQLVSQLSAQYNNE